MHYLAVEGYDRTDGDTDSGPFQLGSQLGANLVQGDMRPSSPSVWRRTISVDSLTVVDLCFPWVKATGAVLNDI